jgi:hypothetical protein
MAIYGSSSDGAASRAAAEASSEAASAKRGVGELEDEIARLKLVCAAAWELLKEHAKLTEEDLIAKVAVLDAKDGVADGKLTRGIRVCTKCGRTVAARNIRCLYCGTVQVAATVFEGI